MPMNPAPWNPITCDAAFDLMTDASRDGSAELSRHLDRCPRCRQMYETLSPALGLFAAERDVSTSGSTIGDETSAVQLAEQVADTLSRTVTSPPTRRGWNRSLMAGAVVLIVGAATVVGATAWFSPTHAPQRSTVADCTWVNHAAAPPDRPSHAVVLSCVACHISPTAE